MGHTDLFEVGRTHATSLPEFYIFEASTRCLLTSIASWLAWICGLAKTCKVSRLVLSSETTWKPPGLASLPWRLYRWCMMHILCHTYTCSHKYCIIDLNKADKHADHISFDHNVQAFSFACGKCDHWSCGQKASSGESHQQILTDRIQLAFLRLGIWQAVFKHPLPMLMLVRGAILSLSFPVICKAQFCLAKTWRSLNN